MMKEKVTLVPGLDVRCTSNSAPAVAFVSGLLCNCDEDFWQDLAHRLIERFDWNIIFVSPHLYAQ